MEIDKIAYIRIENGKILSTKSKGRTVYYFTSLYKSNK